MRKVRKPRTIVKVGAAAVAVMLAAAASTSHAAEKEVFVEAGEPLNVIGSATHDMRQEGDALVIPGPALSGNSWGNTLFGGASVDLGDFHLHARLTLSELTGSGISFLLGGHYHYPQSEPAGTLTVRLALDGADGTIRFGQMPRKAPWSEAKQQAIAAAGDLITPGQPFTLDWIRQDGHSIVRINSEEILRTQLDEFILPTGDGGWPVHVGFIVPDDATLLLHDFRAVGRIVREHQEHVAVWSHGDGGYRMFRGRGLCVTPKGTLIAATGARGLRDKPGSKVRVWCTVRRSTDGGKTWSDQQVVRRPGANPSPSFVIDYETGDIFMIINGRESESTRRPDAGRRYAPVILKTEDDGLTWSEPRSMEVIRDDMRTLFAGPTPGLQLTQGPHKGRLVVPGTYIEVGKGVREGSHGVVFYSDDHGRTWHLGGKVNEHTSEPTLAELNGGVLVSSSRSMDLSRDGTPMSVSYDGGETFTDYFEPVGAPDHGGSGNHVHCLTRYALPGESPAPDAPLLLSSGARPRNTMTIYVSHDGGKMWPISRVVYPGHCADSYMIVLPDGRLALLYDKDGYRSVSLTTFPLEWLLKGQEN